MKEGKLLLSSHISEIIYTTANGFFRYNYDLARLEFIYNDTKLIARTWMIPADQWEALPSKPEYCENIVKKTNRQKISDKKAGKKPLLIVIVLAIAIAGFEIIQLYNSHTLEPGDVKRIIAEVGFAVIVFGITSRVGNE